MPNDYVIYYTFIYFNLQALDSAPVKIKFGLLKTGITTLLIQI